MLGTLLVRIESPWQVDCSRSSQSLRGGLEMRKLFLGIALPLSLVLYPIPLRADTITFTATLNGASEGPPSPWTGFSSVIIDTLAGTMNIHTLSLIGLGLGGLAFSRRKRRAVQNS